MAKITDWNQVRIIISAYNGTNAQDIYRRLGWSWAEWSKFMKTGSIPKR